MAVTETGSKLSAQARKLLAERVAGSEHGERVDVLIRIKDPASRVWRARLAEAGVALRTVAGDVCTASVPIDALEEIAGRAEVLAVEVTTPLDPEALPQNEPLPTD